MELNFHHGWISSRDIYVKEEGIIKNSQDSQISRKKKKCWTVSKSEIRDDTGLNF